MPVDRAQIPWVLAGMAGVALATHLLARRYFHRQLVALKARMRLPGVQAGWDGLSSSHGRMMPWSEITSVSRRAWYAFIESGTEWIAVSFDDPEWPRVLHHLRRLPGWDQASWERTKPGEIAWSGSPRRGPWRRWRDEGLPVPDPEMLNAMRAAAASGSDSPPVTVFARSEGIELVADPERRVLRWDDVDLALFVRDPQDDSLLRVRLAFLSIFQDAALVVPVGAAGREQLVEAMGRHLPGADAAAFRDVVSQRSGGRTLLWSRAPRPGALPLTALGSVTDPEDDR